MKSQSSYTPIILIGAARSGTKMLRDVIGSHQDIAKIPFDINFVWKYNNEKISHDVLNPKQLSQSTNNFIHKYFDKFAADKPFLIEKTVSNSLRIDFVRSVFPNAKFIYLLRDGRDVVESVVRQWGQSPPNSYLFEKLKSFPVLRTLSYGFSYGMDLLKIKILGKPSSSYVWGVKYPGYEKDLSEDKIFKFCAIQWKACIESSEKQIKNIDADKLFKVKYEDFVKNPKESLKSISSFIGVSPNFDADKISKISAKNIGKSFKNLTSQQQKEVVDIINPVLEEHGYVQ